MYIYRLFVGGVFCFISMFWLYC